MSGGRLLYAFGIEPALMPVDHPAYLSLGQHRPLYQLLSKTPLILSQRRYQPADCLPRSGLHSPRSSSPFPASSSQPSSPVSSELRSCFRREGSGLNKKHVVFADTIGLALTSVRQFIPEPTPPSSELPMKPSFAKLQDQQSPSDNLQRYKLCLGFPQPAFDLKTFLTRGMRVQLESCSISENSLSGKVLVSHEGIEESVHVRVTFDSWQSHHEIPCTFLKQQHYGGSDMKVFAFDLSLPKNIDPKERVEFIVLFQPGPGTMQHCDDNQGQKYRVCVETDGSNGHQEDAYRGYLTISQYRPLQMNFGTQNFTDPRRTTLDIQNSFDSQHLQRSLSSRVRDWRAMSSAMQ
ncbi:hypothetical protein PBY51_023311 [Eleginops maclovinus]|uniref:CBM21 domain-containing protein n=1 Tax=Eleginops maclovinus TaxID=56733 RepID=A0AAN7X0L7_ELEMC|nr:hypothetical protein PBY51_023311 [Eleginops maclovinus]